MGEPVSGTHIGTNTGTPWMELEGTSNMAIKFKSGATGLHFGTWGARGTKNGYNFQAHCTKGMLEFNYRDGEIVLWCDPNQGDLGGMSREEMESDSAQPRSRVISDDMDTQKHTQAEMKHFIDCIKKGCVPETDLKSGLQSLRVIWRLYEAERRGVVANLRGLGLDQFSPEPDPFLAETKRFGYTCNLKELFA